MTTLHNSKRCFSIFLLFATVFAHAVTPLKYLDGQTRPFEALRGSWVVVNYWATWCSHCLDEIPALNRFYDQHKGENITVLGINYEGLPMERQQQLAKQYDLHYPSLVDDPAESLHLGDIRGLPVTFLFNPEGQLATVMYGPQTEDSLVKAIKAASKKRSTL